MFLFLADLLVFSLFVHQLILFQQYILPGKKCTIAMHTLIILFVSKVWPSHQIRPSSQCNDSRPLKCKDPKLDFVLVQNFPISTPCYRTERLTLTMVPFCVLLLVFCGLARAGEDLNHFYEVPYDKERPKGAIQPKYNVLFISEFDFLMSRIFWNG